MINKVCGIILAGGKSRRMGTDKTLLRFKGKTLIEILIDTLGDLCENILISSNKELKTGTNYKIVADVISSNGPIAGIYSCLMQSESEYNLVVASDTPLISQDLLKFLIDNAIPERISAIVQENGFVEPLCAIYPKSVLNDLRKFIQDGNYKLNDFLRQNKYYPVLLSKKVEFRDPHLFLNVNNPGDYEKLLSIESNPKFQ